MNNEYIHKIKVNIFNKQPDNKWQKKHPYHNYLDYKHLLVHSIVLMNWKCNICKIDYNQIIMDIDAQNVMLIYVKNV